MIVALAATTGWAQINSGSTGADGALIVNSSTNINMADHPTGIYQYTSVNISSSGAVTFTPNAENTPVVWLVQGNCTNSGSINIYGSSPSGGAGGIPGQVDTAAAMPEAEGLLLVMDLVLAVGDCQRTVMEEMLHLAARAPLQLRVCGWYHLRKCLPGSLNWRLR